MVWYYLFISTASLLSFLGCLDKMPPDQKEQFKSTFMHECLKDSIKLMKDGEKQYLEIYKKIIIYAQKSK